MAQYLFQRDSFTSFLCGGLSRTAEELLLPEYSLSLCSTSTSCLVFPPILPAWPISIYLKYDWQNTDNSPTPHNCHIYVEGLCQSHAGSLVVGTQTLWVSRCQVICFLGFLMMSVIPLAVTYSFVHCKCSHFLIKIIDWPITVGSRQL